jgi:transcriptional regulator
MYVPAPFDASDPGWCHALIRSESFGILVGTGEDGVPFATHLPFLLDAARGPKGTLLGHVARANPQWRAFAGGRPALAVFLGPHAYVSPSAYEVHPSVPTWNYVAVHAYGVPRVVDDDPGVRAFLAALVREFEPAGPEAWSIETLPEDYLAKMMRGIVVFQLPIDRLEGKAKLSQNRGATDRAGVRRALATRGDHLAGAVAALMAEREPGRAAAGTSGWPPAARP